MTQGSSIPLRGISLTRVSKLAEASSGTACLPFQDFFFSPFFSPAYPFFLPPSAKLPQIFLQESSNFWKYADFRQAAGIPRNSKEIQ